jgi:hypothetical protein
VIVFIPDGLPQHVKSFIHVEWIAIGHRGFILALLQTSATAITTATINTKIR